MYETGDLGRLPPRHTTSTCDGKITDKPTRCVDFDGRLSKRMKFVHTSNSLIRLKQGRVGQLMERNMNNAKGVGEPGNVHKVDGIASVRIKSSIE